MKSDVHENWLMCRICLKPPEKSMIKIFHENEERDLTKMLRDCGGVPIKRFDQYPDKICPKCYKYLRVAYKFRLTCQTSHNHLTEIIASAKVDNKDEMTEEWEAEEPSEIEVAETADQKMDREDILAIKQELAEIEKEGSEVDGVVDVYEPMYDDLEANEAAYEELDNIPTIEDENDDDIEKEIKEEDDEYFDDFMADVSTSDDEFQPNKSTKKQTKGTKSPRKSQATDAKDTPTRKTRGRPPKKPADAVEEPKKKRGPKPKPLSTYICHMCGNIYPTQGRLNEHLKLHKGLKPHECEICGHAFAQTQQLARHMNTHTGNRPFKCAYCPAAFADLSTRNKHHRIHTNERPYVCDVCNKTFTYTNTLKFHKMIHTGEKPHVCDICGKGFLQSYKMRNHRLIHLKKGIKLERLEVGEVTVFNETTEAAVLEICAQ